MRLFGAGSRVRSALAVAPRSVVRPSMLRLGVFRQEQRWFATKGKKEPAGKGAVADVKAPVSRAADGPDIDAIAENNPATRPSPPSLEKRMATENQNLYTAKSLLAEMTAEDCSRFYTVDPEMHTSLPEPFRAPIEDELHFNGNFLMLREMVQGVLQDMKQLAADPKNPQGQVYGFYGQRGCGKSTALIQASLFAKQNNWLLLPVAGKNFILDRDGFITPSHRGEDAHPKGLYDQARWTVKYFEKLLGAEAEKLGQIKLKNKNSLPAGQGSTLLDLVTLGSQSREHAPKLLYSFVDEILQVDEMPVLVAMDDVNAWDQVSEFIDPKTMKQLQASQLASVNAFSKFLSTAPKRGAVAFAFTGSCTHKRAKAVLEGATKRVEVRPYNDDELIRMLYHYSMSYFLMPDQLSLDFIGRAKLISGSVGRELRFYSALL